MTAAPGIDEQLVASERQVSEEPVLDDRGDHVVLHGDVERQDRGLHRRGEGVELRVEVPVLAAVDGVDPAVAVAHDPRVVDREWGDAFQRLLDGPREVVDRGIRAEVADECRMRSERCSGHQAELLLEGEVELDHGPTGAGIGPEEHSVSDVGQLRPPY